MKHLCGIMKAGSISPFARRLSFSGDEGSGKSGEPPMSVIMIMLLVVVNHSYNLSKPATSPRGSRRVSRRRCRSMRGLSSEFIAIHYIYIYTHIYMFLFHLFIRFLSISGMPQHARLVQRVHSYSLATHSLLPMI